MMSQEEIEQRTFENMVRFHKAELYQIHNGGASTSILGIALSRKVKRLGIIEPLEDNLKRYKLTPRAVKILKEKRK